MKSNYYLSKEEPIQSCLLALRDIILNFDETISETIKYGAPCFIFKGKPFCYLWMDKKLNQPYILIVNGKQIDHPKLEQGDRKKMKIFRVDPNKDIELETINEILSLAIQL